MLQDRKLIVILGPTASGKSVLGVQLAKKFRGVVISADSRQVYRGLDIGTANITKKEMGGVPHYLLDVASPKAQYSVARYVKDVEQVLKRIPVTTPIFLVGGTPFYIKALTVPSAFSPIPPNAALRRRLAEWSTTRLIARLQKLDPARLQTIDTANRRRLIRAIEIASHRPPPHTRTSGVVALPHFQTLKIGLHVNRSVLYKRIDQRVDARMTKLIQEVKKLHGHGLSWPRLESFGLEYRFTARYLQEKISRAEAAEHIKFGSHAFVRRQMTWWRKEKDIRWVQKSSQAKRLVQKFLK